MANSSEIEHILDIIKKSEDNQNLEALKNMSPNHRLGVKKLRPEAIIPTKAHMTDLGLDLYAVEDTVLHPGAVTKVSTGIALEFPYGIGGIIRDRSSVATKQRAFVVAGVIDPDYRGEIIVAFYNPGAPELIGKRSMSGVIDMTTTYELVDHRYVRFEKGDKIAQLILTPVVQYPIIEVTSISETTRNDGGFGSSGV